LNPTSNLSSWQGWTIVTKFRDPWKGVVADGQTCALFSQIQMTIQLKLCGQSIVSISNNYTPQQSNHLSTFYDDVFAFALIPIEKRQDRWGSFVIALTPTRCLQFLLMTLNFKCQSQCCTLCFFFNLMFTKMSLGWFGIEVLHWTSQIKLQKIEKPPNVRSISHPISNRFGQFKVIPHWFMSIAFLVIIIQLRNFV